MKRLYVVSLMKKMIVSHSSTAHFGALDGKGQEDS